MICVGVTDSVTAGVILCDSVTTGDLVDDNVTAAVSEGVFVTAGVIAFDKETTGVKVEDGVAKAVGVMEGVTKQFRGQPMAKKRPVDVKLSPERMELQFHLQSRMS